MNIFGLGMGSIEFRETADVLQFALNHVLTKAQIDAALNAAGKSSNADHYSALSDENKAIVLDFALSNKLTHDALAKQVQAAEDAIPQDSPARGRQFQYSDTGEGRANTGIFYHTIERLKLAKQNPDMFKGQVLAEAQHPTQVKEMLLLLKATNTDKQIRIIPLFEDPEVLETLDVTMGQLHHDPHVFRHLVNVSLADWDEKVHRGLQAKLPDDVKTAILHLADIMAKGRGDFESVRGEYEAAKADLENTLHTRKLPPLHDIVTTQSQLAHSDNTRRGGMAGSRGGIYKAHKVIRNSASELGMGANMYEGGSHTDSFRMGVRSYRSLVNLYNNHNFMKATVQGMDLAQLFSSPATIEAYIEENLSSAAHRLHERSLHSHLRGNQAISESYVDRAIAEQDSILNTVTKEVETYRTEFFGGSGKGGDLPPNVILGNIIAQVFNYEENSKAGTLGSRSGGRSKTNDQSNYLNPVTDTRTIGYSETFQHGSLNPNFIGAGRLFEKLTSDDLFKVSKDYEARGTSPRGVFKQVMQDTPEELRLNKLYKDNRMLRDAIDRVGYAIATTNFETVWDNARHDYSSGTQQPRTLIIGTQEQIEKGQSHTETVSHRPDVNELEALAKDKDKSAAGFLAWMEVEYRSAAQMVIQAIMPEKLVPGLVDSIDMKTATTREIAATVRDILPMYKEMMGRQDILLQTANYIQHTIPKSQREGTLEGVENGMNKALHNLRDMATLTRPPFRSELRNQKLIKSVDHEMNTAKVASR